MGVDKVRIKLFVDAYLIYAGNNEMKTTLTSTQTLECHTINTN
jgi:hypothetical protein